MGENKAALIWDLDGTLLDSYTIIVDSLYETYAAHNIILDKEEIHRHVIKYSVSSFLQYMEETKGMPFSELKSIYSEISAKKKLEIVLIPHAKETLEKLSESGVRNFVFTHRGATTHDVLKKLGIEDYFEEIITSLEGFARKPQPDAIHYLLEKYELDPEKTYYVGDRTIDMECAKNAGIKSILYFPANSYGEKTGFETYVIEDLLDILGIKFV